jgi:hypothetical protein
MGRNRQSHAKVPGGIRHRNHRQLPLRHRGDGSHDRAILEIAPWTVLSDDDPKSYEFCHEML